MSFLIRNVCRGIAHGVCVLRSSVLQSRCLSLTNHWNAYQSVNPGNGNYTSTVLKAQDPIMSSLTTASTAAEVFSTLQSHQPSLSYKHHVQALRTLFELQKKDLTQKDIIKDPAFEVLCQNIKKESTLLDMNEIIDVLKVVSYLGAPVNSLIVQTTLQLIRCQINELNVRQILFIDFILSKLDPKNHLVDVLKLALPLVFQIQLPLELDREDLPLLREMLSYCCYHNLPNKCINNIVTSLLINEQRFDAQTAKSIVFSLCFINCTKEVYPTRATLLHTSFEALVESILELPYGDVLWLMSKLKGRILEKHPEYYHQRLLDAVGDYLVQRKVPFENSLLIARIFSRIAHCHLPLMEHLCEQALLEQDCLAKAKPMVLISFINCLSNTNYIPQLDKWKMLKSDISKNPIMESDNLALPWSKLCVELASLRYYDDRLVRKVSSEQYLNKVLNNNPSNLDCVQLLMVQEAYRTFHDPTVSLPAGAQAAGRAVYPVHPITEQIADCLAWGLSSKDFVVTNVMLENGFVADILLCVQSNQLVPLPQLPKPKMGKVPIAKLDLPRDSIAVCLMCFTQNCYSLNSSRLRGNFQLLLNIIEHQGYLAVPINVSQWLATPAHEKSPFLMREVRHKCGELGLGTLNQKMKTDHVFF